jgi:hypothetical protein
VQADVLGERGQGICYELLTELCGRNEPYFHPHRLGDKHPTFDFLVELLGSEGYFFFVQVKSTTLGYRSAGNRRRLRVNVDREDVQKMLASPAPVYLVGIDEPHRLGYLLSMNEPREVGLGGLPTRHLLDCNNLKLLWQEVNNFWTSRKKELHGSCFL